VPRGPRGGGVVVEVGSKARKDGCWPGERPKDRRGGQECSARRQVITPKMADLSRLCSLSAHGFLIVN